MLGRLTMWHGVIVCGLLAALLSAATPALAAFTWDPNNSMSGIQDGGGTWSTSVSNWTSDGGTTHASWTSSTTSSNGAIFGGGTDGTYGVTVSGSFSAAGITFNNSGYTLSASSASTITLGSGSVTTASGKTATIGNNVTVTRSGTFATSGDLVIGSGGILEVTNSSTLNLTAGTVTVNGTLCQTGGGNILVRNAAILTVSSGTIIATTSADSTKGLAISDSTGAGTVNLNVGGTIQAGRVTDGDASATTASTFNFAGGTLQAVVADNASFMQGLSTVNVKDGGARIDTNGFNVTIAQPLLHFVDATNDGLTKLGTGSLTLMGVNTYSGTTIVKAGTLILGSTGTIANSSTLVVGDTGSAGAVLDVTSKTSGFMISSGQTLKGIGTLNASGTTVTVNGTVDPGDGVGALTVNGNVVFGDSSNYTVQLSGGASDRLIISGNLSLPSLLDNLTISGSADGVSNYVIATYSGTLTGIFNNVSGLSTGYSIDYGTGSNSQITLAVPEPGSACLLALAVPVLLNSRRRR